MQPEVPPDWNPRDPAVLQDQLRAYDDLRARCPVAYSGPLQWSVLGHADVLRVLLDADSFSNEVSSHTSIPNGMDPPAHTPWRALIEPYFDAQVLQAFEPVAAAIARELVLGLPRAGEVEWMAIFADECAVRLLCAFMGWSSELHAPLRAWSRRNQAATLAGDREAMAAIAFEFDGHIRAQLTARQQDPAHAPDLTTRLLAETIDGRPLRPDEIVSIVRNWTVGELSTLSASLGILAEYLASRPQLQQQLRADPALLPAAIDEILRIDPPLIANRRVARRATCLGGREIPEGARLTLMWASANRDAAVFGDPDAFRPDRDPADNLLYGAGVHVCPGAGLSRLQLRVVLQAVLQGLRQIERVPGREPVRAHYPAGGFSRLPLRVERVPA